MAKVNSAAAAFAVSKAVLTVQANNSSRNYGQNNPHLFYGISGLRNGDSGRVITGAPAESTHHTLRPPNASAKASQEANLEEASGSTLRADRKQQGPREDTGRRAGRNNPPHPRSAARSVCRQERDKPR